MTQMWEFAIKDFHVTIMNILKKLEEKIFKKDEKRSISTENGISKNQFTGIF